MLRAMQRAIVARVLLAAAPLVAGCGGSSAKPPAPTPPPAAAADPEGEAPAGGLTEADLNLRAIEKGARAAFAETGSFPSGAVPPTPATPCCEGPGNRCPVEPDAWRGPIWEAFLFEVVEPHRFQYAYTSDGKTYTVTAVGDLDCDGTTVQYELRGSVGDDGMPTSDLVRPTGAD
jgi:hypothetical protein